jgi:uncharacterized cupredoxin-like copper-binding protein
MLIRMTRDLLPKRRPAARRRLLAAALVAVPLLAACGKSAGSSTNTKNPLPANPSVTINATDNKYDGKEYTAKAGDVAFAMYNKGNINHSLVVKSSDGTRIGDRLLLAPGKSGGVTVNLPAGVYEVYCDIPGHKDSGMDAKLTVS